MTSVQMILLPIDIDQSKNEMFRNDPECAAVLDVYPGYYHIVGFNLPWIGYMATFDGKEMVGCGGYKGQPKDGRIEIAYGTFKKFQGKGVGKEICRQLVLLCRATDPSVTVTARTLIENTASVQILKYNGFVCLGIVHDPDDGDVWEWEFRDHTL
jgi:[ribosomal protein S5]-alanine N-acetyltransferase